MTTYTLIRVALAIESRWSVGRAPEAGETADLAASVDPRRPGPDGYAPYLPGSSLAGSLRRHLAEVGSAWLGEPPPSWEEQREVSQEDREPSRLAVLGVLPIEAAVDSGGATSIDGRRAAGNGLRQIEWVRPADVVVAFEHEGPTDETLLKKLSSWTPTVGRGRSTGMGVARVTSVQHVSVDLTDPRQLTWWMTSRRSWFSSVVGAIPALKPDTRAGLDRMPAAWSVDLTWRVREPVHVGVIDPTPGDPLLMMRLSQQAIVPGSAWKGLYRHRIQAILSAVTDDTAASSRIVASLFGTSTSGRGLLRFTDSLADPGAAVITRSHVAIDRFTGGARDGALYQVEALDAKTLLSQHIESDRELPEPVVNLLRHVARDLHEGYLGVGGMVSRGYGWVQLEDPTFATRCTGVSVDEIVAALDALEVVREAADTGPDMEVAT